MTRSFPPENESQLRTDLTQVKVTSRDLERLAPVLKLNDRSLGRWLASGMTMAEAVQHEKEYAGLLADYERKLKPRRGEARRQANERRRSVRGG